MQEASFIVFLTVKRMDLMSAIRFLVTFQRHQFEDKSGTRLADYFMTNYFHKSWQTNDSLIMRGYELSGRGNSCLKDIQVTKCSSKYTKIHLKNMVSITKKYICMYLYTRTMRKSRKFSQRGSNFDNVSFVVFYRGGQTLTYFFFFFS